MSPDAERLLTRQRAGALNERDLELAAYLGSDAAREVLAGSGAEAPEALGEWLSGLDPWGEAAQARALVALVQFGLDRAEAPAELAQDLLAALAARVRQPGAASTQRLLRAGRTFERSLVDPLEEPAGAQGALLELVENAIQALAEEDALGELLEEVGTGAVYLVTQGLPFPSGDAGSIAEVMARQQREAASEVRLEVEAALLPWSLKEADVLDELRESEARALPDGLLSGLDAIDWSGLRHAYGSAGDVPELLRELAAPSATRREQALHELYGNIWHQGTVYEATQYAVPFLLELVGAECVGGKEQILHLLSCLARGSSYHEAHASLTTEAERESAEYQARIAVERSWVEAARAAVQAGLPVYCQLLAHPDALVREMAAYVASVCPEGRQELAMALEARLDGESNPRARASFLFALVALCPRHEREPLLGRLSPRLAQGSPAARFATAVALAQVSLDAPGLLEVLGATAAARAELSGSPWLEGADPIAFVSEGFAERWPERLRFIQGLLGAEDADLCRDAIHAAEELMRAYRPAAARLVPPLAELLAGSHPLVRASAVSALASAGSAARAASESLLQLLQSGRGDDRQRGLALVTLCRLRDTRVVPIVAEVLAAAPPLSGWYGRVLQHLGPWGPELLPSLVELVPRLPSGNEAIFAIQAVGRFGEAAASAVPMLLERLEGEGLAVCLALASIGPTAAPHLAPVRELLQHSDYGLRANAARAVWRVARDGPAVLASMRALLATGDRHLLSRALEVLEMLGPEARRFTHDIRPLLDLDDPYGWIRVRAARVLWRATREAEGLIPPLLEHLSCKPVGRLAAECLGEMGPLAAEAIPILREAVESELRQPEIGTPDGWVDQDEAWLEVATRALEQIVAS